MGLSDEKGRKVKTKILADREMNLHKAIQKELENWDMLLKVRHGIVSIKGRGCLRMKLMWKSLKTDKLFHKKHNIKTGDNVMQGLQCSAENLD